MQRLRFPLPGFASHPLTLALLLLVLVQGCLCAAGLFVRGDALQAYSYFNCALSNFLLHGEFPQWLPYAAMGCPAEPYSLVFLGPFQIVLILLGGLLGIGQAWNLFFLGAVLELAVFVVSVWLLGREIYASRFAAAAVTVCAVLLGYWHVQIFWSHKMVVFFPLLLYYAVRLHKTGDFVHLWRGGTAFVLMLLGNLAYIAPISLLCCLVFYAALRLFSRTRPRLSAQGILNRESLATALIFTFLAAGFLWLLGHAFDNLAIISPGRDAQTKTVTLDQFLNYGTLAVDKLPEFFLGVPVPRYSVEMLFYLGAAPTALILLALWRVRTVQFGSMLALAVFLFLLSLGTYGGVAYAVYHLPFVNTFRHLGHLLPLVRLLGLFLAGFGLEALASGGRERCRDLAVCLAVTAVLFLSLKWSVFASYAPKDWTGFVPEIGLAALAAGLVGIRCRRKNPDWALLALPALVVALELAMAQYILFFSLPLFVENGRFASDAIDVFAAQRHAFQAGRMADSSREPRWEVVVGLSMRQPVNNSTLFLLTGIEPCAPIFRVDYATKGVLRLLEDKAPGALQASNKELAPLVALRGDHWRLALLDPEYRRLCACGGGKLVLNPDGPSPRDVSPGVRHFSANRLSVEVDQNEPGGRLFYSDAFHPGWKAQVDGAPVAVEMAGQAFKAVEVPRGRHVVEFAFYDPLKEWLRRMLGIVSVAALGWFLWREARRDGYPESPRH